MSALCGSGTVVAWRGEEKIGGNGALGTASGVDSSETSLLNRACDLGEFVVAPGGEEIIELCRQCCAVWLSSPFFLALQFGESL
jgi:hypothetical protein